MPAEERVVSAAHAVLARSASADVSDPALTEAVEVVLGEMLVAERVRDYLELFRPVVKALVELSVRLARPRWEGVLAALSQLLELTEADLSWIYRAFVVKLLPDMLQTAPEDDDAGATRTRAQAVGAALLRCALPDKLGKQSEDRNELQLRRVALGGVLALPPPVCEGIVRDMVAALPSSQQACVALLLNPSTPDTMRAAFDSCLCALADDDAPRAAARAVVETVLRQTYDGFGNARVGVWCDRLINCESQLDSVDGRRRLVREVLQPLTHHLSAPATREKARDVVQTRISVLFLCHLFAVLWSAYERGDAVDTESEKDGLSVLECARGLVDLSAHAALEPASGSQDTQTTMPASQRAAFLAPLLSYLPTEDSTAAVRDVMKLPIPLLECFLLLTLRALPLLPSPCPAASEPTTANADNPTPPIAEDDLVRVVRFLKTTVQPAVDAVVWRAESDASRVGAAKAPSSDGAPAQENTAKTECASGATRPLPSQIAVMRSVAKRTQLLWHAVTERRSRRGTRGMTTWPGSWSASDEGTAPVAATPPVTPGNDGAAHRRAGRKRRR